MRLLSFLILACSSTSLLWADELANSDFSDGRAHWSGDAQDPPDSGATDPFATNSSPSGVIIKLKKDAWSKIYQTFPVKDANLYYTITLKLSSDYQIAPPNTANPPYSRVDLSELPNPPDLNLAEDRWFLSITQNGNPAPPFFRSLFPDPFKAQPLTLTGKVTPLT